MFVIFGIGGRNSFRRAFRVGQSKRKCATVSSGHGQRGHLESVTTPILLRCELRVGILAERWLLVPPFSVSLWGLLDLGLSCS